MTQLEAIWNILNRKTNNKVTYDLARKMGIRNLRARISDLRKDGFDIETDFRENRKTRELEVFYSLNR
jgi:hypothetical protein